MLPSLVAWDFSPEEEQHLRLLLADAWSVVAASRQAPAVAHEGAPPQAALVRVRGDQPQPALGLQAFRAEYSDLPAILLQDDGHEYPLAWPFAAGIHNILLLPAAYHDGAHQLLRTLYLLFDPAWATDLRHLSGAHHTVHHRPVRTKHDKAAVCEEIEATLRANGNDAASISHVRVCLEETLNNGLFHAFLTAAGDERYSVETFTELASGDEVRLDWCIMGDRFLFAVADNAGNLKPATLFRKLEAGDSGASLLDERGRGLFLLRALCAEVMYNLWPGHMTQSVMLVESPARLSRCRPLLVNIIAGQPSQAKPA